MSSMKNFKSRLSQKRSNSQSGINDSSFSRSIAGQYDIKNLMMNCNNTVEFKLQKNSQDIIKIKPFKLQLANQTGTRIFVHVSATRYDYFEISPTKYILQNGTCLQVNIIAIQIPYAQLQDYQRQKIQISWGVILSHQIDNKLKPKITEFKTINIIIKNKQLINEYLAKTSYNSKNQFHNNDNNRNNKNNFISSNTKNYDKNNHNLLQIQSRNILQNSYNQDSRMYNEAKSGFDQSAFRQTQEAYGQRSSLLTMNIIMMIAGVGFLIGLLMG